MFFNGIAIFFYPYAIEGWWLNKIQEGNPILLLSHPLIVVIGVGYLFRGACFHSSFTFTKLNLLSSSTLPLP